jgi:GDPmannose 4,6-dehydratase
MWLMLQTDQAEDFVIATGEANSLKDFIDHTFSYFSLDWTEHVLHDEQLMRPNEIALSQGNPEKSYKVLGWQASKHMRDVINILCSEK